MARVWHNRTSEVWILDTEKSEITRMLRDGTKEVQGVQDTLTSTSLPDVAIALEAVFRAPNSGLDLHKG